MSAPARLWRRQLSGVVERWPEAYRLLLIARHRNAPFLRRIVTPGHDIVIEGFPRSATSFAVAAFMRANGWRDPRVATHVHSPAQLVLAARWGIPAIVTIRDPEAAVTGWMAYARQSGQLPALSPRAARAWVRAQTLRHARFHETIAPLGVHFVFARFAETTRDFGAVIARVNEKFGTDFNLFEHTAEAEDEIFRRARQHLSPHPARDEMKAGFVALYRAPANAAARHRAEAAYRAVRAAGEARARPEPREMPPAHAPVS